MIVKIWPIKGARGFKNSLLYVDDDNKVIKKKIDVKDAFTNEFLPSEK